MSDLHQHLTDRITRARLKLEARRAARPALVWACGLVVGLGCLTYILTHVAERTFRDTAKVQFRVDTARGVVAGRDEARVKGIEAGTITDVRLDSRGAVLTAEIEDGYGPIYRDAKATLRPDTPLQDMALDIVDRGTPAAGKADADEPLPASATSTSVNAAEVLQAFSPEVRARLATVLDQLGRGLDDRGASLRAAFVELAPTIAVAGRVSRQLAANATSTRRLVTNTRLITDELARRDTALRGLVRDGGRTLRTIGERDAPFEATIAALPGTLTRLDATLSTVADVLPAVDGAVDALGPVVAELPSALADLRGLSDDARPAIRALQTPVRRLTPLSTALDTVSADLQRGVAALRPQLPAVTKAIQKTSMCGPALQRFFQWTPSVFKLGDHRGSAPRADGILAINSTAVIREPRYFAFPACAGGAPVGGRPGPGGALHQGEDGR